MSLPWPSAPMPQASAAAAPPLEPPGVTPLFHGFSVAPCRSLSVNQRQENAGVLVRPIMIAPALRQLATGGASASAMTSRKATTPLVVAWPRWSVLTLTVTGTPCSGPNGSPRRTCSSAAPAAASASSPSVSTTALMRGLTAARRSSAAETASRAEIARVRIACARPAASHCQSCPCIESLFPRRKALIATRRNLGELDPGQLVLVVKEVAQLRAGDRGKARRGRVIGLALKLDRADQAAAGGGRKPALDQAQETQGIADHVGEQPIDWADGGGIERERALGDVFDPGEPRHLGRERRPIDADNARTQSRQSPAPAARAAPQIEADLARPGPLADNGQRLPEL